MLPKKSPNLRFDIYRITQSSMSEKRTWALLPHQADEINSHLNEGFSPDEFHVDPDEYGPITCELVAQMMRDLAADPETPITIVSTAHGSFCTHCQKNGNNTPAASTMHKPNKQSSELLKS
jgi:hypothetical protein